MAGMKVGLLGFHTAVSLGELLAVAVIVIFNFV
jgi:hypothetical protein